MQSNGTPRRHDRFRFQGLLAWLVAPVLAVPATAGVPSDSLDPDGPISREARSLLPENEPEFDLRTDVPDSGFGGSFEAFLWAELDRRSGRSDSAIDQLRLAGLHHPEVRLELASLYYERGEIDSALVHGERAAADLPQSAEACLILGRCHLSRGQADEAIGWLQEALRRGPDNNQAFLNLLAALQRAGRYEEALALLEPAVPENMASGNLYATRAGLRLREGRRMAAIEDLAVAVQKDPGAPTFMQGLLREIARLDDPLEGVPVLERLISQEPNLLPPRRALVGVLATSDRWREALGPLHDLLARDETDVRSRVQLGLLFARDGQDQQAEDEWLKATRQAPEDAEGWRWLCRSAARADDWTVLAARADSLRARAPSDAEGWWFTGVARYQMEDGPGALEALEQVLDVEPDHREACLLASSLLIDSGRNQEAEARLRVFVDAHPGDIGALYRWAVSLEQTGRFDESVAAFDRLLELEPRHDAALNYVGYMCIDRGVDLENALARVQRAVEIDPDNAAYLDSVGWGFRTAGRHREAVAPLEKAVSLAGKNAVILKHLGIVYQELGRTEDAIRVFRRARSADPEDPEVRSRLTALQG